MYLTSFLVWKLLLLNVLILVQPVMNIKLFTLTFNRVFIGRLRSFWGCRIRRVLTCGQLVVLLQNCSWGCQSFLGAPITIKSVELSKA